MSGYVEKKKDELAVLGANGALDLQRSSVEELQLARIYTRQKIEVSLALGYKSEDDESDEDEEEGKLFFREALP